MTHDPLDPGPREERVRQVLRELPRPAADHAFRARLRTDFVSGRIRERRELVLGRPRHARWRWALVPVVALVALVVVLALDRPPGWIVVVAGGDGMVVVDGKPVAVQHLAELSRLIRPGARVRTTGATHLRIASRGFGLVEVTPGSDMTIPGVPGRWFGRRVAGEVQSGVVRFSTLPAFRGARLALTTPEARVMVTGTTLAVLAMPEGTCVCVLEGRVGIAERGGGELVGIPEGRRRMIPTSGRPIDDRMLAQEVEPLRELGSARDRMMSR